MSTTVKWIIILVIGGLIIITNLSMAKKPVEISPIITSPTGIGQLNNKPGQIDDSTIKQLTGLTFVQTFSRPLFNPDRRKFQPAPPPPKPKPVAIKAKPKRKVPAPNLRLLGVSISTDSSSALIEDGTGNNSRWFKKGDKFGSWILKDIEKNTITISFEDQIVTIDLYPEER